MINYFLGNLGKSNFFYGSVDRLNLNREVTPYLFCNRNNMYILDVLIYLYSLKKILYFIQSSYSKRVKMFIVYENEFISNIFLKKLKKYFLTINKSNNFFIKKNISTNLNLYLFLYRYRKIVLNKLVPEIYYFYKQDKDLILNQFFSKFFLKKKKRFNKKDIINSRTQGFSFKKFKRFIIRSLIYNKKLKNYINNYKEILLLLKDFKSKFLVLKIEDFFILYNFFFKKLCTKRLLLNSRYILIKNPHYNFLWLYFYKKNIKGPVHNFFIKSPIRNYILDKRKIKYFYKLKKKIFLKIKFLNSKRIIYLKFLKSIKRNFFIKKLIKIKNTIKILDKFYFIIRSFLNKLFDSKKVLTNSNHLDFLIKKNKIFLWSNRWIKGSLTNFYELKKKFKLDKNFRLVYYMRTLAEIYIYIYLKDVENFQKEIIKLAIPLVSISSISYSFNFFSYYVLSNKNDETLKYFYFNLILESFFRGYLVELNNFFKK